MLTPVATPIFEDDAAGRAAIEALLRPRPYDPAAALAHAQALLPEKLQRDPHWLPLILICANSNLDWLLQNINFTRLELTGQVMGRLDNLSSGEYVLSTLALHLFNDHYKLPTGGLTNLRLLDDWHFELALHAIRIHSRGVQ
jgi:hypothetical protein